MNQRQGPLETTHYEIRVQGHLDEYWSTWFGGMSLLREDDGTTILRGLVTDQAALHGLLAQVRDLGTALISVAVVEPTSPARTHLVQTPRQETSP